MAGIGRRPGSPAEAGRSGGRDCPGTVADEAQREQQRQHQDVQRQTADRLAFRVQHVGDAERLGHVAVMGDAGDGEDARGGQAKQSMLAIGDRIGAELCGERQLRRHRGQRTAVVHIDRSPGKLHAATGRLEQRERRNLQHDADGDHVDQHGQRPPPEPAALEFDAVSRIGQLGTSENAGFDHPVRCCPASVDLTSRRNRGFPWIAPRSIRDRLRSVTKPSRMLRQLTAKRNTP